MRTQVVFSWLMMLVGFLTAVAAVASETPKLQSMDQYTRIQIPVAAGSTFRLINGQNGEATLVVDRIRPGALDAVKSWQDSRLRGVALNPVGLDTVELKLQFKSSATESFAYLQGGMVVVDLWAGATPSAPPILARKLPTVIKQAKAPTRKIASVPVKAAPPVRPLRREIDLFQRFILPMPELRIEAKGAGFDLPPRGEIEELWKFSAGKPNSEAGASYEFAQKLYREKKFGLALKTIEISRRDHPESPHTNELKLLEALCYRRLGEATKTEALALKSEQLLEELGGQRDKAGRPMPFQKAIRLYFAQKEFNRGNWLQAIQHLEFVANSTTEDDLDLPFVHTMLAEAYTKVNQPRRSERVYRFLFERYPQHALAKEARYRIANLLAVEKNYNRVTEEGEAALAAYPEYEKNRSEVLFNMGEANFWLGRYAKAEKYFRRFTEISPAQTNAALAWVRVGEILELSKGDVAGAREAYFRAKNSYPFSRGDLVATVRIARIDVETEKEPAFIVKTLQGMLTDKTIDGELRRMAELTLAEYLLITGEIDKAVELSRVGMAQTEGNAYEAYKLAYIKSLFTKIGALNREKKFSESLALYEKEKKWLDLYGPEIFRAMADAYRGLGLYATSNDLMERYAKEARGGRSLASRAQEEELSLAKGKNSYARGDYAEALAHLPDDDDGEIIAMRALAEFRLGRKKNAYLAADRALARTEVNKLSDAVLSDLAEVLIDRSMVERDFGRMEKDIGRVKKLLSKEDERLTFAAADALWYQKKHDQAEKAYEAAIAAYPKGDRTDRARYHQGMSFISLGKSDAAVKVLTTLKESGGSVWAESAKQELDLLAWEKKYSSVLRTLPPSGLGISN
jgi:tetratricopeptide (TPR) repeat protein